MLQKLCLQQISFFSQHKFIITHFYISIFAPKNRERKNLLLFKKYLAHKQEKSTNIILTY